jgi:hypothetical protein
MAQVIVYTNDNGNVSVCYPTGELPIEDVLAKDCPEGAMIIDTDDLPQGDDDFFDAWRLVDGIVVVDLATAKTLATSRFNEAAKITADERSRNIAIGIANDVSDADFITGLTAKRAAIAAATSTAELRQIVVSYYEH